MVEVKEKLNQWLASLGEGHNKHLSIKCGVNATEAEIIAHNRGVIDVLKRMDAYELCRVIIEEFNINKRSFEHFEVYSDIEIPVGTLFSNISLIGVYMPQGDGFLLTLTGTLTTSEIDRIQKESDKQSESRLKRWWGLVTNN